MARPSAQLLAIVKRSVGSTKKVRSRKKNRDPKVKSRKFQ